MSAKDLKGRHVGALLRRWQTEGLPIFTIKNRMVVLRWWAEKIGNPGAIMSDENLVLERLIAPTPDAGLVVSEFPES